METSTHHLKPEPVRTTEFTLALDESEAEQALAPGYEPLLIGRAWKAGRYSGEDFTIQADGTAWRPAGNKLFLQERRQEQEGSLRMTSRAWQLAHAAGRRR